MAPRLDIDEKAFILALAVEYPKSIKVIQDNFYSKFGRIVTNTTIYGILNSAEIPTFNKITRPNWGGYRNGLTDGGLENLHRLYDGDIKEISKIVKQEPLNLARRCLKMGLEVKNIPKAVKQKGSDQDYYPIARYFVSLRRG